MHCSKEVAPDSGTMIELSLSILGQQVGKKHITHQARLVFARTNTWGWCDFIPLRTLKDLKKSYLVGSKCIVNADISIIGSANDA
jgi:hypothetical protein